MPLSSQKLAPVSLARHYNRRVWMGRALWLVAAALCVWLVLALVDYRSGDGAALDVAERRVAYALTTEPPNLNHTTSTDSTSILILSHVMEGLLRYGIDGKLEGGVAERWQLRADGASFYLRENARWSDGEPVTADDFVFAWRTALDPASASPYAFLLYPLKNAEQINRGELPPAALGVKAVDARTLEVAFAKPCPYFLSLTAFMTYYPLREDFYTAQGERYAADSENLLYNGPFVLSQWQHDARLQLDKNHHYWDRANIWLNGIDIPYITANPAARFNLFRDGRIAIADGLNETSRLQALNQRMNIGSFFDGALFYLELNHRAGHYTANRAFRRALQLAVNGDDLVYKVMGQPGTRPARSMFPSWMMGARETFQQEYPPAQITLSESGARAALAQAKRELGVSDFAPITLLADDTEGGNKAAVYFQARLKKVLGLEVKVDVQIFKQRLEKARRGDFDLAMVAWGPDYNDLLTFGDLFSSFNANNNGAYKSLRYDHWVAVAQQSIDVAERLRAFAEMQNILIEDAAVIPLYERGVTYVQDARLKNVARHVVGAATDFRFARIEAEVKP